MTLAEPAVAAGETTGETTGGHTTTVPLYGITEWHSITLQPRNDVELIDEIVESHVACGFDHIVWDLGRSSLVYQSAIPGATIYGELSDLALGRAKPHIRALIEKTCPLRRALQVGGERQVTIWGRLAMNRHYGTPDAGALTSRFARDHPEWWERDKGGREVTHKLCYAIPEVRRERIEILLEAQRIGVRGLVLDFCRQPPILLYHDALVRPFIAEHGSDPRLLDSDDPGVYREWFAYRAGVLTAFMRALRAAVREQERRLGRACPIIVRVPDNAQWLLLAYGLDVEAWLAGDLIDGTMLSPFPLAIEDPEQYPEQHVAQAHRSGKTCVGGIGALGLWRLEEPVAPDYHPKPVYALAARLFAAAVDGLSVYQTESLTWRPWLRQLWEEIGDPRIVAARLAELPDPPTDFPVGMDWHSRYDRSWPRLPRRQPHTLRMSAGPGAAL